MDDRHGAVGRHAGVEVLHVAVGGREAASRGHLDLRLAGRFALDGEHAAQEPAAVLLGLDRLHRGRDAVAGLHLKLDDVGLLRRVHVGIVDHDPHGRPVAEAADRFEHEHAALGRLLVVEERGRERGRVVGDGEPILVPRAAGRGRDRIDVAGRDRVARQHFELRVFAEGERILRDRQAADAGGVGERDLRDPGGHALGAEDHEPHEPGMRALGEGHLDPARAGRDRGRQRDLGPHALGERGRIEHRVGARHEIRLALGIAQQRGGALLESVAAARVPPDLDRMEARSKLAFDGERVSSVLRRWLAVDEENRVRRSLVVRRGIPRELEPADR